MACPKLGVVARAKVDRIVDGDTLDVTITQKVRVRLKDCWAPEMHGTERQRGEQAKAFLQSKLPVSTRVVVEVPTTEADDVADVLTFGRVVGNVYLPGQSESLNQQMIAAGFATQKNER